MGWKRQFYALPYSFTPPLCGRPVSQASRLTSPTTSPGRALDPPLGVEPATPLLCAGTGPTAAACLAPPALRGALGKVAAGPLRAWVTAAGSSYDWALRVLKSWLQEQLEPWTRQQELWGWWGNHLCAHSWALANDGPWMVKLMTHQQLWWVWSCMEEF